MEIDPIKTEDDYEATLKLIETLMDAPVGSPEGERLSILVTLVEAYEKQHYPSDATDPIEALHFRLEQMGLGDRAEKVLKAAVELHQGDAEAAWHWLETPALGLGELRPVELMHTAAGRESVYLLIQRLRHGSLP